MDCLQSYITTLKIRCRSFWRNIIIHYHSIVDANIDCNFPLDFFFAAKTVPLLLWSFVKEIYHIMEKLICAAILYKGQKIGLCGMPLICHERLSVQTYTNILPLSPFVDLLRNKDRTALYTFPSILILWNSENSTIIWFANI